MLWLALKLRRDPLHENPTLVIVTDRKDLDEQITKTFVACGFPNPEQAESVRDLRACSRGRRARPSSPRCRSSRSWLGRATEGRSASRGRSSRPLNEARNIFVLTDEAHRTQYGGLAANMRKALPNAAFFGFTGTPIDKNDRSTLSDVRPVHRHVHDRAGRRGRRDGPDLLRGSARPSFASSATPSTPSSTASSPIEARRSGRRSRRSTGPSRPSRERRSESRRSPRPHRPLHQVHRPNGFKAQVVGCTREIAVLYKEALDRLNGPQSAVIISGSNKDAEHLVKHHTSEEQRKELIAAS
jgi:type I restriction enzyme R subunit